MLCVAATAVAQVGERLTNEVPDLSRDASTDELLESAREMFIADNYRLSEMLYKTVLVRDPNHLDAMLELSVVYEKMGKLQHARGLLDRASTLDPYDKEINRRSTEILQKMSAALASEVDSLLTAGAYHQALPKLSALLTTQPENAELYYKRAVCHVELGQADAAIAEIDKALGLQLNDRYQALKDKAQEQKLANRVHQLTSTAKRHIRTDTEAGRQEALDAISTILEINPADPWATEKFQELTEYEGGSADPADGSGSSLGAAWGGVKWAMGYIGRTVAGLATVLSAHIKLLMTLLVLLLLLNSPLTRVIITRIDARIPHGGSLSGRLDYYSIQEILQLINTHSRTGLLRVKTPHAKGLIFFSKGEIYHSASGNLTGREALQNLISKSEEGTFSFKEGVTTDSETVDSPLSLILMELPERRENITTQTILAKRKKQSKMSELLEGSRSSTPD
jgi:tetratricopeptide (TPR) repeat protein